jgi:cellulose synthase (UDP-forming)
VISHAEEVEVWLKKSLRLRRSASVAYIVISIVYLVWRLTVFNPQAPICSFLFYLAAILDFILGLNMIFASWTHLRRKFPPQTKSYTVDVLVPVYTEPVAMIELTVMAAKGIDTPHETYLLDDGHREELRQVALKHDVHYLRRPTNQGAKAGNMNYGLAHGTGELVAVFDADHIAQREALQKLVGFFDDEKVAMAQTPQSFYNEDAFIYRDAYVGIRRWSEQAFFYEVSQPCRDTYNGASCVGTGVVYRRRALDEIGGFPTQTITEDVHTSLLFHTHGWKTVYLNEPVAWGVAAADVPEYSKTRQRWTHGNLHAVCLENVLFCRGLTWRQRASYLCVALSFLEGWQQLLYILIPAYVMIFYVAPIQIGIFNILLVLGIPLLQILLGLVIGGGFVRFIDGQIFAIGRLHLFLAGTMGLFGRRMRWQVSLKNVLGTVSFSLLLPQILISATGILAITYALAREFNILSQPSPGRDLDYIGLISCLWIVFNTLRALYWIRETIVLAGYTHQEYMFEVPISILDMKGGLLGHATRLSTREALASWLEGKTPQAGQAIQFLIPGYIVKSQISAIKNDGAFSFTCAEPSQLERLKRSLYSVDWHKQIHLAPLSYRAKKENLDGPWQPAAVYLQSTAADSPSWAVIQTKGENNSRPKLIISEPLQARDKLVVKWLHNRQERESAFSIHAIIHTEHQIPKDLNDCQYMILELDPL